MPLTLHLSVMPPILSVGTGGSLRSIRSKLLLLIMEGEEEEEAFPFVESGVVRLFNLAGKGGRR